MDPAFLFVLSLPHQPLPDDGKHILLLVRRKLAPLGDGMPLLKTAPAAAAGGVLSYEHGVVLHGCLLAVIGDVGGEKAGLEQILGMLHYGIKPFLVKIRQLPPFQVEAASEFGVCQPFEQLVHI